MNNFKEIKPELIRKNPFSAIGKEWMLIAAGNREKQNAMTASWGGLGVMFGKNVAFVFVRPQRYTKEFMDSEETFSLSFLDKEYRKVLNYFGTVSGRDEDKIAKSGLTVSYHGTTPYFGEANLVLICKKLFVQPSLWFSGNLYEQHSPFQPGTIFFRTGPGNLHIVRRRHKVPIYQP